MPASGTPMSTRIWPCVRPARPRPATRSGAKRRRRNPPVAAELTGALKADEPFMRDTTAAMARATAIDRAGVPPSLALLLDRVFVESTLGAASGADASLAFAALDD